VRFIVSSLVANEMHDLPAVCKPNELINFSPPAGQTCSAWAQDYINASGGYLSNPNATDVCHYCPLATGDEYFEPLGIKFSERGRDLGIMIVFIAFNCVATVLCTKYLRFANR
jgi:ATP-binding cassette, subfamily G (WHITE), member 2, SNQ2